MKTRAGFVSNSSSSSFVVLRNDFFGKEKYLLTPKDEKKLIDYGFKKVSCLRADQVDCDIYHETKKSIKDARKKLEKTFSKKLKKEIKDLAKCNSNYDDYFNYGYSITCNQDFVVYFLLKNNISFEASCHYGDYTVIYRKNQKYFLILQNYGTQCSMRDSYKEILGRTGWVQEKAIEKVSVKKWLKKEELWHKKDLFKQEMADENT